MTLLLPMRLNSYTLPDAKDPMRLIDFPAMLLLCLTMAAAQTPAPLLQPDDRLKADVLLVVAHPDDETGAVAWLAQLIDQHKRGAGIYPTHAKAAPYNIGPEPPPSP